MQVQCVVKREWSLGVGRLGLPTFVLSIQADGRETFLLAARRRPKANKSKGQSFLICQERSDLGKGGSYIAKLKGNFLGTEWMLYDNGLKADDAVALARQQKFGAGSGAGGRKDARKDAGLGATAVPFAELSPAPSNR